MKNEWISEKEKCCYDCKYLKAKVSWWCVNKNAIKWRGTSIPGVKNCPFWEGPVNPMDDVPGGTEFDMIKLSLILLLLMSIFLIGLIGFIEIF